MVRRVETVTNLVTIAALLTITSIAVLRYIDQRSTGQARTEPVRAYAQGDAMEQVDSVEYAGARATLMLFVRSTCGFCTESMPFYRQILDLEAARSGALQVIAVGHETAEVLKAYLQSHGAQVRSVVSIPPGTLRLQGTPTLVLVDNTGHVIKEWRGLLPSTGEEELKKTILEATQTSATD